MIPLVGRKLRSDSGDSMLVPAMVSFAVILLVVAFGIDLTKGGFVKTDYTDKAQKASQMSIQTIDSRGSLDWEAAEVFSKEYEKLRGIDGSQGKCSDLPSGQEAPLYTFTLKTNRGGSQDTVSWTTSNPSSDLGTAPVLDGSVVYRSINVEIKDATPNLLLDIFGKPCQVVGVNVSAISFGSQADL